MKTLITIGHNHFVLGPKVKASALVNALEGALEVEWDYHMEGNGPKEYIVKGPVEIRIEQVPEDLFKSPPKPLSADEVATRRINGARVVRQISNGRAG